MIHRYRVGLSVEVEGDHDRVYEVDRIGESREPGERFQRQKSIDPFGRP